MHPGTLAQAKGCLTNHIAHNLRRYVESFKFRASRNKWTRIGKAFQMHYNKYKVCFAGLNMPTDSNAVDRLII